MWNTKIEYFLELSEKQEFVQINFHLTDKICKGYIRAVNGDGVFVTAKMGDDQRVRISDVKFVPYLAISLVECGL
jgi:hypothetical protein